MYLKKTVVIVIHAALTVFIHLCWSKEQNAVTLCVCEIYRTTVKMFKVTKGRRTNRLDKF